MTIDRRLPLTISLRVVYQRIFAAIAFLVSPCSALSLSCAEPEEPIQTTIAAAYDRADVVIVGQVSSGRGSDTKPQRVRVSRVWKGSVPAEVLVSSFGGYEAHKEQAIFARGHHLGYYLAEECLSFPDTARVVEVLESLYGEARRPLTQPNRFPAVWYVVMIALGLVGVAAFTVRQIRK